MQDTTQGTSSGQSSFFLATQKLAHSYFNTAKSYSDLKQVPEAVEHYQQAINLYTQIKDYYWHDQALKSLAGVYSSISDLDNAITLQQHRLNLAQQFGNRQNEQDAWYQVGVIQDSCNQHQEAISCFSQSLTLAFALNEQGGLADTHFMLGKGYAALKQVPEALEHYQQAVNLYAQTKNYYWHEQALRSLAELYGSINEYTNVITVQQQCLNLAQLTSNCQSEQSALYNIGCAYSSGQHYEQAVDYLLRALNMAEELDDPWKIASAHYMLGGSYVALQQSSNVTAGYTAALEVRTRTAFPVEWATSQNNLAIAYSDRIRGDKADNLERAIECYTAALEVRTRTAFPVEWATSQNNLAAAYSDRIRGDRADNIERAIEGYRAALEIQTPTTLPADCLQIGRNLGDLAFQEGRWEIAIEGYRAAIAAVEQSRAWADPTRQEEVHAQAAEVYANLVQSYVNLKRYDKAIEIVERSRSQFLVELMATADVYAKGEIPTEVQQALAQYNTLQQQIDALRRPDAQGDGPRGQLVGADRSRSGAMQADLEGTIAALEAEKQTVWQTLRQYDRTLAEQIQVTALDFATMQALLQGQPHTAVVCFFSTPQHTHILVVRPDQPPQCHTCLNQGDHLHTWIFEQWIRPYIDDKPTWRAQMPAFLHELADRLQLSHLVETHLKGITELILIPHLYLHQIPFAALPLEDQYLGDRFRLRTISSYQLLQACSDRDPVKGDRPYGIVSDTRNDLLFSRFEAEQVAELFTHPPAQQIQGQAAATYATYRQLLLQSGEKAVQAVLSSHHAYSRLDAPLASGLCLGDRDLTLGELLSPSWRMPDLDEVFLSCCETGLGLVKNRTDDILTLGTGFLYAGARGVISSLWVVDDMATALFSIFYHRERKQGSDRVTALQTAQRHLRDLSGEQMKEEFSEKLKAYLTERSNQAFDQGDEKTGGKLMYLCEYGLKTFHEKDRPFAALEYWAAFTCQGLP